MENELEKSKEQVAFEKWAAEQGYNLAAHPAAGNDRYFYLDNNYFYYDTRDVWAAWKARAELKPDSDVNQDSLQERHDFLLLACRDAQDLASRYGKALYDISQGAGDRTTARQALREGNKNG